LETQRQILVFGNSPMLAALAASLRVSPLLDVVERRDGNENFPLGGVHPDMILVDAVQVTPEQFCELLAACPQSRPSILSIDPFTYQLTVLSSPNHAQPLAETARVIGILSLALPQPA
jgi:hypothetical protein